MKKSQVFIFIANIHGIPGATLTQSGKPSTRILNYS